MTPTPSDLDASDAICGKATCPMCGAATKQHTAQILFECGSIDNLLGFLQSPECARKATLARLESDLESRNQQCRELMAENERLRGDNAAGRHIMQRIRSVLVECDSELSAIAHGRPPSSKEELASLYSRCREIYESIERPTTLTQGDAE